MAQRKGRASSQNDDRPVVTVLGPGQMGLVCAGLLAAGGTGPVPTDVEPSGGRPLCRPVRVKLWGHDDVELGRLSQTRKSPRLEGFRLPDEVEVVLRDDAAVADASLIVSAIPVQYIRDVWTRLSPHVPAGAGVLSVAKGIENMTLLRPTQVVSDVLRQTGKDNPDARPRRYACLSGPTIAAELSRCLPAAMIAASDDLAFAREVQCLFGNSWMRIYTNPDMLGVELAGAVKNVIAIAAGIVDGLQAGNNAKSALLARGLAEIARLGLAMGAQHDTFFGIAGVGDLATTCFSPEGRNRSCGEALGKGVKLADYLRTSPYVVEGVATTKSVMELARKYRVDMPITSAVHAVLFEGMDPIEAIGQLMAREMKAEKVG
ncbi:MAG TPA: NAD(P)H-dependent glycerol-3-phosphate dehydrogenase [Phycisphaerales bacterium]|nr:NAD(P)H-dependent glycerol-3-phosphate dehydrogenase [Phycisphaerales bacterium]